MENAHYELLPKHGTRLCSSLHGSPLDNSPTTPMTPYEIQDVRMGTTVPNRKSPAQYTVNETTTVTSQPFTGYFWHSGVFRNVPWIGLLSLLLAIVSTIASAIILVLSNGAAVSSWTASPHVLLAVLSVVITGCMKVSLSSGVRIAWWYGVLRAVPLSETHRVWAFGDSLRAALMSGRHFNLIALATILVSIAMVEGPLIQMASSISTRRISKPINISSSLADNIPAGYTAVSTGESFFPTIHSSIFSGVYNNYSIRAPIDGGFQGCPGVCNASVPGVGFKVKCQQYETPLSMEDYQKDQWPRGSMPQFLTNTSWDGLGWGTGCPGGCNESLTVNVGWADNSRQVFVNRVCNLSLAIVSYPLSLSQLTATFQLPLGVNPRVISDLPSAHTGGSIASKFSTLGGFYLLGNNGGPFYANTSMAINGAAGLYTLFGLNSFSWSHAVNLDWDIDMGNYTWLDPTPDILSAYHEIMFRLALNVASNATSALSDPLDDTKYLHIQNVSALYISEENYYVSNLLYLAGAMTVIVVGVLSVLQM